MDGLANLNLSEFQPKNWFAKKTLFWQENSEKIPLLFWSGRTNFRRTLPLFSYHASGISYTISVSRDKQLIISRYYDVLDKTTIQFISSAMFCKWINKKTPKNMNNFHWFNPELEVFLAPIIKAEKIFSITNTEIRREAIKKVGIKEIMYEFREHITLFEKNEIGEQLFEIAVPRGRLWNNPMRFMWVRDGTDLDEWYLLQVPRFFYGGDFQREDDIPVVSLHIAKAWSFDIHPTQYKPVRET